ncbi:hypothetical protein QOT17_021365 [Balamuthia mandrillaris]
MNVAAAVGRRSLAAPPPPPPPAAGSRFAAAVVVGGGARLKPGGWLAGGRQMRGFSSSSSSLLPSRRFGAHAAAASASALCLFSGRCGRSSSFVLVPPRTRSSLPFVPSRGKTTGKINNNTNNGLKRLIAHCRQVFLPSDEESAGEGDAAQKEEETGPRSSLSLLLTPSFATHPNYFYRLLQLMKNETSASSSSSSSSFAEGEPNRHKNKGERIEALVQVMIHPRVVGGRKTNAYLCAQLLQILTEDAHKKESQDAEQERERKGRRWQQCKALWMAMISTNVKRNTFIYTHLIHSAAPLLQHLNQMKNELPDRERELEEEIEEVLREVKQIFVYMTEEEAEKEEEKTGQEPKGEQTPSTASNGEVTVWNVLLNLLIKNGRWSEAYQLYRQQQKENIEAEESGKKKRKRIPEAITYQILLKGCPSTEEAAQLLEEAIRNGCVRTQLCNVFLETLSHLASSRKVKTNNGEEGESLVMFELYRRMKKEDQTQAEAEAFPRPDGFTFSILLDHCSRERLFIHGEQLLEQDLPQFLPNWQQDSVLGASIINFYAKKGDHEAALRWFRRMEEGGKLSIRHFNCLLTSFINPSSLRYDTFVFRDSPPTLMEEEEEKNRKEERAKMMAQVEALREEMQRKWGLEGSAITYDYLILAAGKLANDDNKVWSLFREMTQQRLRPAPMTFGYLSEAIATSFADSLSHASSLEERKKMIQTAEEELMRVLQEIKKWGRPLKAYRRDSYHLLFRPLTDFYGRVGQLQQCRHLLRALLHRSSLSTQQLFDSLLEARQEEPAAEPTVLVTQLISDFTAEEERQEAKANALTGLHLAHLIKACLVNQKHNEAEEILKAMRRASSSSATTPTLFAPDGKTYVTFLSYCLAAGGDEEKLRGLRVLQWMREDGVLPTNDYAKEVIRRLEEE